MRALESTAGTPRQTPGPRQAPGLRQARQAWQMRQARKARWRAVVAATCVPLVFASACSTLPRDTDPQVIRSFQPMPEEAPPVGPEPGQEPDLLLRDFYSASAIPAGDYEAARLFLGEEAARSWEPDDSRFLVDAIDLTTSSTSSSSDERTFNVRGNIIGSLRAGGSYVSENSGYEAQIKMQRINGEWRIVDLPDGVVFERNELRNQYQPQALYFYDQTGRTLVNDRRWLYSGRDSLDVELITLLMQGPSEGLAPATKSFIPTEAEFLGVENGIYRFSGMSALNEDERLKVAAEIVWVLSNAGVQGPYSIEADGAPLVEGLDSMTTDDFADFNPRVAANTVAPLYAVNEGRILRISANTATPLGGTLGEDNTVESADIAADGEVAAVRTDGDRSQLMIGNIGGEVSESVSARTISRPTFEFGGRAAWVVIDGNRIIRAVRSSTTGEVAEAEVNSSALSDIDGEISVLRLSRTGARVAMIIGGSVYIGVVERSESGDYRIGDVRAMASELGETALSLDWQADGSLVVGTSTPETPVWRIEQDGSSVSTLPSGNITAPVVSIAASPSTLYLTDFHAMLQLPIESDSTYWREVPGLQGRRSAPIVAD